MSGPTPWDPDTEFIIRPSHTPVSVDGYAEGEPQILECPDCGTQRLITPEPSRGVDELGHEKDCPQRFVKSNWWRERCCGDEP